MGPPARLSGAAPAPEPERFTLRAADGVALEATWVAPPNAPRAVAVLAHAMFARRTAWARPRGAGFDEDLARRGVASLAFDFRGHGGSGPGKAAGGAGWGYDDLVRLDLPAAVAEARAHAPGVPLLLVGHSLGGHVALAATGTRRCAPDALVTVATNVWLRACEPRAARWAAKRALAHAMITVTRRTGYFPARRLRQGSDDESLGYVEDLDRIVRGSWSSRDGADDYFAALAAVRAPVAVVASAADTLNAAEASVRAFHAPLGGPTRVELVRQADDGGPAPDHMGLVTSTGARGALARAVAWALDQARP